VPLLPNRSGRLVVRRGPSIMIAFHTGRQVRDGHPKGPDPIGLQNKWDWIELDSTPRSQILKIFEQIQLPAKLLNYFLWSDKSNFHQVLDYVPKNLSTRGFENFFIFPFFFLPLHSTAVLIRNFSPKKSCTRNLTSVWTFVKLPFLGDFALKWQNWKYFCILINGFFTQNRNILRSNIFCNVLQLRRRRA